MPIEQRNNLEIYDDVAPDWWSDDIRWMRTVKNLVPGRLAWFNHHIDWTEKTVLDLGCAVQSRSCCRPTNLAGATWFKQAW